LISTGGVAAENIGLYLKAGASAVSVESILVSQKILDERKFSLLAERATKMREEVIRAREG
jgi:2-keto-3-deoxy-6-phosphogluconate aldolase